MKESAERFGALLKFYRERSFDSEQGGTLTQARLAELADCGVTGATVGHWERGRRAIKHYDRYTLRQLISVLHRYGGLRSVDEANALLESGLYSGLTLEEARKIDASWAADMQRSDPEVQPVSASPVALVVSPAAIYEALDALFGWSEADDHARSSWAGKFLWSMSVLSRRMTADRAFHVLSYLILWVVTAWLVTPILSWSVGEPSLRLRSAVLFAAASVLVPCTVALLTSPDAPAGETADKLSHGWQRFLLKLTGAAVGYGLVALVLFFLGLGASYIGFEGEAAIWGWRLAAAATLLMAHVGARRIPADRYRPTGSNISFYETDMLFLVCFLLSGAAVGALVYWFYDLLASPATGLSLLVIAAGMALWERQKQDPAPEPLLIFALGAVAPFLLLCLYMLFFPLPEMAAAIGTLPVMSIVSVFIYVLSLTLVTVTAILRNGLSLTLRGALAFLLVQMIILALLLLGRHWALSGAAIAVILWLGWGRRRFGRHFSLHPGIVVLLIAFLAAVSLQTTSVISPGLILVGYTMISAGLLLWVYAIGQDQVDGNGDVEVG